MSILPIPSSQFLESDLVNITQTRENWSIRKFRIRPNIRLDRLWGEVTVREAQHEAEIDWNTGPNLAI
jgi:hypothetical protein